MKKKRFNKIFNGDFVRRVTDKSEAHPAAVLTSFLTRFGIECGTNPHYCVGDENHPARMYTAIVGTICNRAEPQILRLALLYALLARRDEILTEDLDSAIAFWDYARDSVQYLFAFRQNNSVSAKIMEFLTDEKECSLTDLHHLFRRHIKSERIMTALQELESAGFVQTIRQPTAGRSKVIIRLKSHERSEAFE